MIDDRQLSERLKKGNPVTLVLGAGVSYSRGIPLWADLMRRVWKTVHGTDPYQEDESALEAARRACRAAGLQERFVDRLDVRRHPFELQLAFDAIHQELRWEASDPEYRKKIGIRRRAQPRNRQRESHEADELFSDLIRKELYRGQARSSPKARKGSDTLSLVARAVLRNAKEPVHRRRISRVITFNVDDLLEREVNAGCRRWVPYAIPVARPSAYRPPVTPLSMPIYHLHGFVPKDRKAYSYLFDGGKVPEAAAPVESLVFTDEQYWRATGHSGGFAARVFAEALKDGCLFIGLSMTDVNIIRWLGLDAVERGDDFRRMASSWSDPTEGEQMIVEDLGRHYWIRPEPPSPAYHDVRDFGTRVLEYALGRRGVDCISIPSWESREFKKRWQSWFLGSDR